MLLAECFFSRATYYAKGYSRKGLLVSVYIFLRISFTYCSMIVLASIL